MQATTAATLERLLTGVDARIRGQTDVPLTSIATDSRRVRPGALFFCLPGQHVDGHAFAPAAIAAGARAIVASREIDAPAGVGVAIVDDSQSALSRVAAEFYHHPSAALTCVGITGTNGKTTTTVLLEAIMFAAGLRFGVIGTLGAKLREPSGELGTVEELEHTTPLAHDVQRLLAAFAAAGADGAAIEVSSHALSLHRVDDVEFDVAVLTNVTHDHLDFHETLDEYRAAKRRLFRTPDGRRKAPLRAALNGDDEEGRRLASSMKARLTFGVDNDAALLNATGVTFDPAGSTFFVKALRPAAFRVKLPGPFNVSNAMAAITAACAMDVDPEAIAEGLQTVNAVPGRMTVMSTKDISVYVDYAHTPDGLQEVLKAARRLTANRLVCVFGCGGDRDRAKRPLMGQAAAALADRVIVTSDNPRDEDANAIIADIVSGIQGSHEVVEDRAQAIELAISEARPGDVIVIAGKGHETHQIVGDRRLPFSDVAVARLALDKARPCH
ncbi:MAG: UDP-N-acetylmuramoyl-L-alanyl-D-glutamate--2,6-diaminopimelate ligase [Candidatus Eremiobacter antarcticus]|nr:UDP-N-acetylmuramoyl-L-alanyl-D-glutamate--2,6-diaminopimelate ligase [Candidatus Eremiobacteraeota bacterium]MBC5808347.1 UDP-N-acetylmuramoyl-L-alanyl-D-glutamate--2,6-diaminopimelate ligase [Candidatus Eremiobacteraeota bacterium]PZR63715.1 MAG: UDP-N-acetylmuramoyl-L-alanyl-D-glutamate--2,6-diaminopimelate ligase [Candidatus Eremiobacter sp. RRmetagenome_bin22]